MKITLRQMAYFDALADTLSFGRAADRMHVSQPALSVQIRQMERRLGGPLVERLHRDVRLTRRGWSVLDRVRQILASVEELESSARRSQNGGQIHLGVIPTVAPYLVPPVLDRLRRQPAAFGLRLREAQTALLLDELAAARLDAIVIAAPKGTGGLVCRPLVDDRFLLAGTTERLRRLGLRTEALRPVNLDPDDLLLLDEGHCLADQALEVCALERRQMPADLGASSLSTLCQLAAADHGLTLLPEICLAAERKSAQGLAAARFARPEPARELALVRRASTDPEDWFEPLAKLLADEAAILVAKSRAEIR